MNKTHTFRRDVVFTFANETYDADYTVNGGCVEDVGLTVLRRETEDGWVNVPESDPQYVQLLDAAQKAAEQDYTNERYES